MELSSLSVCVPGDCPNNCRFCVSKSRQADAAAQVEARPREELRREILRRMEFCRDGGCIILLMTGHGEPLGNLAFLEDIAACNAGLSHPFRWVELQTSGVFLDEEKLRFLKQTLRVSTLALTVSSLDSQWNHTYNGTPDALKVDIDETCRTIRAAGFNLRLSVSLTDQVSARDLFGRCRDLGADQVTLRRLCDSGYETDQDRWIAQHAMTSTSYALIKDHVLRCGRELEVLPFGALRYSVDGMSVALDEDTVGPGAKRAMRNLILQADGRLYSRWDDEGSLLF